MKCLMIVGLVLSIIGTIIVGFGIPKPGQIIKARKAKLLYIGWACIGLGFVGQLIATILG